MVVAAALLATSVLAPFVGVAGAVPDARVAVTDATVTPATPTAGAPVTVEATVRLSGGSASAADLDRVRVVDANGTTLGEATGLGTLSPGETVTVPVTLVVEDPGAYDLSIVAAVSDADDETMKPGMIWTIEPGLYTESEGYRHSDTVAITEDGTDRLTTFPRSIEGNTIRVE